MKILWIFIIHLIISLVLSVLGLKKRNAQEAFANFSIAFFIPIVGYLVVLNLFFLRKRAKKEVDKERIEESISLHTNRFDRDAVKSIIPLEESLLINENRIKRRQVIDAIKKDAKSYVDFLKLALRNKDAETTHYAASAIMEIKRNLDLKIQALEYEYEHDRENVELLKEYESIINEYLKVGIFDKTDRRKYLSLQKELLIKLLSSGEEISSNYEKLIEALLELKLYEFARIYIDEYLESYGNEASYMLKMKYYFLNHDNLNFHKTIEELRNSNVKLSKKGLEILRFWIEETE